MDIHDELEVLGSQRHRADRERRFVSERLADAIRRAARTGMNEEDISTHTQLTSVEVRAVLDGQEL